MNLQGIALIALERKRQIDHEGWTEEHDDKHSQGELAKAASIYATITQENVMCRIENLSYYGWPWDAGWFKPFSDPPKDDPRYENSFPSVDRIRCLVKAGALIAAEIDRLQRLEQ